MGASCRFLVPLSVLIALGGHIQWRTAPEVNQSNLSIVMDEVSEPFSTAAVSSTLLTPPSATASPLPAILLGLWVCGFLGIACSWWIRWLRIRAVVRASSPLRLEIPIPAPPQLEAVIAHELCHVGYRDNLLAAIHMFVETLFWFHPLVWWIGKRMVEERERACDEQVLQLGGEPRIYAEGILSVCKLYVESPLACVSGVTGANLKKRIAAIMSNRAAAPLSLAKKAALAIGGAAVLAAPMIVGIMNAPYSRAQSAAAPTPKFQVASIKRCKDEPGRRQGGGESSPGRLSIGCLVLAGDNNLGLIQRAYVRNAGGHTNPLGVLAIKGGPDWIHSEMYEINARAEGHPSIQMMEGPMLQALLEDRFKLKIRRETRDGPVYEMTVAKGGSKLKPFQDGSCVQMPMMFPLPELAEGQRYCKAIIVTRPPSVNAEGSTPLEFSKLLNLFLDRPVIDKTGIARRFDIHLSFSPNESTPGVTWTRTRCARRGIGPDRSDDLYRNAGTARVEACAGQGPHRIPRHRSLGEAVRELNVTVSGFDLHATAPKLIQQLRDRGRRITLARNHDRPFEIFAEFPRAYGPRRKRFGCSRADADHRPVPRQVQRRGEARTRAAHDEVIVADDQNPGHG